MFQAGGPITESIRLPNCKLDDEVSPRGRSQSLLWDKAEEQGVTTENNKRGDDPEYVYVVHEKADIEVNSYTNWEPSCRRDDLMGS